MENDRSFQAMCVFSPFTKIKKNSVNIKVKKSKKSNIPLKYKLNGFTKVNCNL